MNENVYNIANNNKCKALIEILALKSAFILMENNVMIRLSTGRMTMSHVFKEVAKYAQMVSTSSPGLFFLFDILPSCVGSPGPG